jgi:hypothetical protein
MQGGWIMEQGLYPSRSEESKTRTALSKADDAVLPVTRWLAIFIIPFLVVAATLLYTWPNNTDKTFAWTIKPSMTPMMLAAAYMGGIYFFVQVARASKWHTIKVGFLPVIAFASFLGVATVLHWDRFNHSHISFFAWSSLYFTTPFLVLAVWLLNRTHDSRKIEPDDRVLSPTIRVIIGMIGGITLLISLFLFLSPLLMISIWPWTLTPLTARVVGAMFALPGVVGLGIALEPRWSAARIILQAQAFSILMILIAAGRAWADFNPDKISTWFFITGLTGLLILIFGFYYWMETGKVTER